LELQQLAATVVQHILELSTTISLLKVGELLGVCSLLLAVAPDAIG